MTKNPPYGDNSRKGTIKKRTQVFNSLVNKWVKRDSNTGRFMDQKFNNDPFKGVIKEK